MSFSQWFAELGPTAQFFVGVSPILGVMFVIFVIGAVTVYRQHKRRSHE